MMESDDRSELHRHPAGQNREQSSARERPADFVVERSVRSLLRRGEVPRMLPQDFVDGVNAGI
jgi:hypothetical protein